MQGLITGIFIFTSMKKALFQLHLAVFLAGFTAILGKLISLNEGMLVWFRLFITVLTLAILSKMRGDFRKLSIKEMMPVFGVGALIAFHWVCFYGSVKYANVSVAVVCLAASGFFTSFFEPLFHRRKVSWVEVLLGVMAITGIYIIFEFHPQYALGIAFGIFSAVGSSLFPIFNKLLIARYPVRTLTFYELLGGLIVLSILLPLYLGWFPQGNYWPTLADWGWLLVLAWICTIYCFDLQLNALHSISAFTSNLAYNLEPVYGIIFGFILFQENKLLSGHFYWGVLLIILAVALQTLRVIRLKPKTGL